jgi:hypothetical protein
MSSPKIFAVVERDSATRLRQPTGEAKRKRNEAAAQREREELGGKTPLSIQGLYKYQRSEGARKRSDYLNSLLARP